jgi:hypothetical protein
MWVCVCMDVSIKQQSEVFLHIPSYSQQIQIKHRFQYWRQLYVYILKQYLEFQVIENTILTFYNNQYNPNLKNGF